MHEGYFQVMAEPVSTCVQVIFELAPRQAPRPDMVWVPDRWAPVPGAPEGVHVPGHWERRLSEREVWVPPLTVIAPGGVQRAWPAGVREPAEARRGP